MQSIAKLASSRLFARACLNQVFRIERATSDDTRAVELDVLRTSLRRYEQLATIEEHDDLRLPRREHVTKNVKLPDEPNVSVEIDENIAPLIEQLWRIDVKTIQCCEDLWSAPGYAEIWFADSASADRFMYCVFSNGTDTQRSRMDPADEKGGLEWYWHVACNRWQWSAQPMMDTGSSMPSIRVVLKFPRSQIAELAELLREISDHDE